MLTPRNALTIRVQLILPLRVGVVPVQATEVYSDKRRTAHERQLSFQLRKIGDDIGAGLGIRNCEVHLGPGNQGARIG
jgi:hypothetical protein